MKAYIVRINLRSTDPLIWRQIIMPADATFHRLHEIIQAAMEFKNTCNYSFDLKEENLRITNDEDAYEGHRHFMANKKFYKERLAKIPANLEEIERAYQDSLKIRVRKPSGIKFDEYMDRCKALSYQYGQLGGWHIDIILEKTLEDYPLGYPQLINGENATPPEELDGAGNFKRFLEIYSDKNHPDHESAKEWSEYVIYRVFDKERINDLLKRIKYKKTEKGA